jgi:hypothetical protein
MSQLATSSYWYVAQVHCPWRFWTFHKVHGNLELIDSVNFYL